jgi:hypothetical protein
MKENGVAFKASGVRWFCQPDLAPFDALIWPHPPVHSDVLATVTPPRFRAGLFPPFLSVLASLLRSALPLYRRLVSPVFVT